jgi:Pyruvate/2-oxoacid:ferredoxin oxidoreductase delta subunit
MTSKRERALSLSKDKALNEIYHWKHVKGRTISKYIINSIIFYQIQITYHTYLKKNVDQYATAKGYESDDDATTELPQFMYCVENCIRRGDDWTKNWIHYDQQDLRDIVMIVAFLNKDNTNDEIK